MKDEYVIINKTDLLKVREKLNKGSAHWDGIYVSDYAMGQIDLIDTIISSQSTPLIPEIEKAYIAGESSRYSRVGEAVLQHNYITNLKLDI